MYMEICFRDNDFSPVFETVLSNLPNIVYKYLPVIIQKDKTFESALDRDIELNRGKLAFIEGFRRLYLDEDKSSFKPVLEKQLKEMILLYLKDNYSDTYDYLKFKVKIKISNKHTIKWRNGESCFGLFLPKGLGIMKPDIVWTE